MSSGLPDPKILLDVLVSVYGWDARCAKSVAAVVGSHHGKPPADKDVPTNIREEEMPQPYGLGWDAMPCSVAFTAGSASAAR